MASRFYFTIPALFRGLLFAVWIGLFPSMAHSSIKVVVSIAPLHSLISAVMQGAGTPVLLIPPGHSPHGTALSPNAVRSMFQSDMLIWLGPQFEVSMVKIVDQLRDRTVVKSILDEDEIRLLPLREMDNWLESVGHDHGGHDHGDHDHAGHDHQRRDADPHIWLDSDNAAAIVEKFTGWITELDKNNAEIYRKNKISVIGRIENTYSQVENLLAPVKSEPYLVFHDAYQYFESEHDLQAVRSISRSVERAAGLKQIRSIRDSIRDMGIECVFKEPQFEPRIVQTIAEQMDVRVGTLDPLGAALTPGPDLWHQLIIALAESLNHCLGD